MEPFIDLAGLTPRPGPLKCVWIPGADGRLECIWVPDWERELDEVAGPEPVRKAS
ncbi:MAG TPA: hypothetical protein VJ456_07350 [Acidimicrobiia bacterium]|nr:hypothetical protein [Acidimicrobiia bacterium]